MSFFLLPSGWIIQPLFFTEFSYWAILILPLFISLINVLLSSCFLILADAVPASNSLDPLGLDRSSPWARKESDTTEVTEHARTQVGISRKIKQERKIMSTRQTGSSHYFITVLLGYQFSSVQSLSHVWLFATSWTAAYQVSLSINKSQSLLKLMSIELVMPSNYLIPYCPFLLLPSIFPSIRVFSNESVHLIRLTKRLEFQLQHQSFQSIFRTDFC